MVKSKKIGSFQRQFGESKKCSRKIIDHADCLRRNVPVSRTTSVFEGHGPIFRGQVHILENRPLYNLIEL